MAAVAVLAAAGPAAAQGFCHPFGGGYGFGVGGPKFGLSVWGGFAPPPPPVFGFGFGPVFPVWDVWGPPVIVVPQPVIVAPPVFGFADAGFGGGVDLAELREAARPRDDPARAARVDDAVRRGDLLVVDPKGDGVRLANAVRPAAKPGPKPEPKPVVMVNPDPPPDPLRRAQAAFEAGELGRAAERLHAVSAADPTAARPHFLLAQVRTAAGQYVEAVAAIRDGMTLDPDWPAAKFAPGDFYGAKAGRLAADVAELEKALDAHPDDPSLLFLVGYHKWFAGQREAAKGVFRKAAARLPDGRDRGVIDRFLNAAK
jgi:hypothetical protein